MPARQMIEEKLQIKHSQGEWHWLHWHYRTNSYPYRILVEALCDCEAFISRAGITLADEIGRIAGSERDVEHYDQILQKFCEILVLKQLGSSTDFTDFTWEIERRAPNTGKSVDLVGERNGTLLGIEVKAPRFTEYANLRANDWQIVTRDSLLRNTLPEATLPRDNSIKDFLISANEKFKGFKTNYSNFVGVLLIVWDDFFHEPITWLKGQAGLLTDNSFFRDDQNKPVKFSNIDAVLVIRHLNYFFEGIRSQNPTEGNNRLFQIGAWEGLPNIYCLLSSENEDLTKLFRAFNALSYDDEVLQNAADYRPQEVIVWQDISPED